MSHVDEGALHAYLDGALDEYPAAEGLQVREHLERCAECAGRLEKERRIREDATAMLGLAVPHVEVPSFEELRAYVKATRPPPSGVSVRIYRLGWAASVVLALGAGWMVRGGQLDRLPVAQSPMPVLEAADEMAERPNAVGRELMQEETSPTAAGAFADAADPGSSEDRIESQAVAAQVAGRTESAGEDLRKVEAPERASPDIGAMEAGLRMANVATDDSVDRDQAQGLPVLDERVAGAGATLATLPAEQVRPLSDTVSIDVIAPPASPPAGQADRESRAAENERMRAQSLVATARIDAVPAAPSSARAVTDAPEVAEEADAEPPIAVPGVFVLSYGNLAEGTTPSGLHIVQRFEDGGIMDVYHLPEGVDPSVLPPLETGRNEVSGERDGGWVVLRAAIPTDALSELLAHLIPGG